MKQSHLLLTSYFCQENGAKKNVSVNTGFARLLTVHMLKSLYAGSGNDFNLMFPEKKEICPKIKYYLMRLKLE